MKPVPTPGNPWRRCRKCTAPFAPKTEHHVYCCGSCRQQSYRDRNRPLYQCPGCGVVLHVGTVTEAGRTVTKHTRYCSARCKHRVYRWRQWGRLLVCGNELCPRYGVKTSHRYHTEAQSWECTGCGQLQPARW